MPAVGVDRAHDAGSAAGCWSRSQATVSASPWRRSTCASQPSSRAGLLHRRPAALRRRPRSVGRWLEREVRRDPRRRPPRSARRSRRPCSSSEAEMLKSSFSAGRRAGRGDDPVGDVVDVGQRARLLAGAEDLQRPLAGQHLGDQVGHGVGDARLVAVGQLARAVGVERAADRVAQPVLVVGGAGVDLAGELGEAVGRARAPGSRRGRPRWSGTRSRARTPSRRRRR